MLNRLAVLATVGGQASACGGERTSTNQPRSGVPVRPAPEGRSVGRVQRRARPGERPPPGLQAP